MNYKLIQLRTLMAQNHIDALIIPGSDPHASEYIAEHWQQRLYISGFTGSAGTVVVTNHSAALWTDSRYFLQAAEQLAGSGIDLMKDGLPETPSVNEWLIDQLESGMTVSVDATMFTVQTVNQLRTELTKKQIILDTTHDLISQMWSDCPDLPHETILTLNREITGVSAREKIELVRESMKSKGQDWMLFATLDDIAWLLNIRGKDISYNPVVIAYALVSNEKAILYIDPRKLDDKAHKHLQEASVETRPYLAVFNDLQQLKGHIALDFNKVNYALYQSIANTCTISHSVSPIVLLKSIKNQTELKGIRLAMIKDGVALTNFLYWLQQEVPSGKVSELSVMEKLYEFRAAQPDFFSESFTTIAGYEAHGAIVHYEATADSNVMLHPKGFLLLDSGGQYTHGTTDITRTIALGPVTDSQRKDYTNVLKGHIALSRIHFPYGTRGTQLDVLARQFLWNAGEQFGHGTGHGVGHFLCVHEGPQSIRMNENPTLLEPGMVTSNEPGLYKANEYGIRIENLIAVEECEDTPFGRFLCFDTLTLCPYDRRAMDLELLTNDEIKWIDQYHQRVYDLIAPSLKPQQKAWLQEQTKPLL